MCAMCRRFRRQMRLVQRAGRTADLPEAMPGQEDAALPAVARERIKQALREQGQGGTGQ